LASEDQKVNSAESSGYKRLINMLVEKNEKRNAKPARMTQRHLFMMSAPDVVDGLLSG
jgi:hypothetical protein